MLFVNDLFTPNVPAWLTHAEADFDGMGLADWVFPGFLFMVGMAVPFAIQSRLKKGHTTVQILSHIIIRTISLLFIGVLMLNASRLNPQSCQGSVETCGQFLCTFLSFWFGISMEI